MAFDPRSVFTDDPFGAWVDSYQPLPVPAAAPGPELSNMAQARLPENYKPKTEAELRASSPFYTQETPAQSAAREGPGERQRLLQEMNPNRGGVPDWAFNPVVMGGLQSGSALAQTLATPLNLITGTDVSGVFQQQQQAMEEEYARRFGEERGFGAKTVSGITSGLADLMMAAGLGGAGGPVLLGKIGIQSYDSGLGEAKAHGLEGWQKQAYAGVNAALEVASEFVTLKVGKGLFAPVKAGLKRAVLQAVLGGTENAAQEALTQFGQNINQAAHGMRDWSAESLMDGVGEAATVGGGVGVLAHGPSVATGGLRDYQASQIRQQRANDPARQQALVMQGQQADLSKGRQQWLDEVARPHVENMVNASQQLADLQRGQQQGAQEQAQQQTEQEARAMERVKALAQTDPDAVRNLAKLTDPSVGNVAKALGFSREQVRQERNWGSRLYREQIVKAAQQFAPPVEGYELRPAGAAAPPVPKIGTKARVEYERRKKAGYELQAPVESGPPATTEHQPSLPLGGVAVEGQQAGTFSEGSAHQNRVLDPATGQYVSVDWKHRMAPQHIKAIQAQATKDNLDPASLKGQVLDDMQQAQEDFALRRLVWDKFQSQVPITVRDKSGKVVGQRAWNTMTPQKVSALMENDETFHKGWDETVGDLLNHHPELGSEERVKQIIFDGAPTAPTVNAEFVAQSAKNLEERLSRVAVSPGRGDAHDRGLPQNVVDPELGFNPAMQNAPYGPHVPVPTGASPYQGGVSRTPASRFPSSGAKSVRLEQVANAIDRVANVATGRKRRTAVGRLHAAGVLGQHNTQTGGIRVGSADDLTTRAHEAAHAISNTTGILSRLSPTADRELTDLGTALYGATVPNAGYQSEGFSEFMRMYLTHPPDAQAAAPEFYKYAEKAFAKRPKVARAIRQAQGAAETWFRKMGSQERLAAQRENPYSFRNKLKAAFGKIFGTLRSEEWNDTLDPLAEVDRITSDLTGHKVQSSASAHQYGVATRNTATGVVNRFISWGTFLPSDPSRKVGLSLEEIMAPIKAAGEYERWSRWNDAESALDSWRAGKNPGVSEADARQTKAELDSPLFQQVGRDVQQWNKEVNAYIATLDPTLADGIKQAEAAYQYYMPRKRMMDQEGGKGTGGYSGAGGAKTGRIDAGRKGSGRAYKDLMPQLIADKYALLKRAQQRRLVGKLIEQVYANVGPGGQPLQAFSHLVDEIHGYDPTKRPLADETIIPWTTNVGGLKQTRYFQITPAMQKIVESMEPARFTGAMNLIFGIPTKAVKTGWMAASPRYGLIRNPMRDIPEMMLKAPGDVSIPRRAAMLPEYFANWARALTGMDNGWMEVAKNLGLQNSVLLSEHTPAPTHTMEKIGKGLVWHDPKSWFDGVLTAYDKAIEVNQSAEAAARYATMRTMADSLGWKPGMPMTEDTAIKLAVAFKEPMGDYGGKGHLFRTIDQIFPLASVPITYGRAFGKYFNVKGASLAFAALTVPTLIAWLRNRDEEWYKNLNARDKYAHIWFAIPELNTAFRWARNSEAGQVFSAIPEFLLNLAYDQNPEHAKDIAEALVDQYSPSGPPLVKEALEQYGNQKFSGGQIVPERGGVSRREPSQQFTEDTSETAKAIGVASGLSPLRIEHAADTLSGGLSKRLTQAGESIIGAKPASREQQLADLPVVGAVFPSGGLTGNRPKPIERLYGLVREAEQKQADPRQPETEGNRERRLTLQEASRAASALFKLRDKTKTVSEREQIMTQITELAKSAETGGNKQEFAGMTRAAKYAAEEDAGTRSDLAFNGLDALTHVKPRLGQAGVDRQNLQKRQAHWEEGQATARSFLGAAKIEPKQAVALYEAELKTRVRGVEARVSRLRRLRSALGL